jgi:hypothetical protein
MEDTKGRLLEVQVVTFARFVRFVPRVPKAALVPRVS